MAVRSVGGMVVAGHDTRGRSRPCPSRSIVALEAVPADTPRVPLIGVLVALQGVACALPAHPGGLATRLPPASHRRHGSPSMRPETCTLPAERGRRPRRAAPRQTAVRARTFG